MSKSDFAWNKALFSHVCRHDWTYMLCHSQIKDDLSPFKSRICLGKFLVIAKSQEKARNSFDCHIKQKSLRGGDSFAVRTGLDLRSLRRRSRIPLTPGAGGGGKMTSDEWRMTNDEWRMGAGGEVKNDEWRMMNDGPLGGKEKLKVKN